MSDLKPGDKIGPFTYGGDMDNADNPASPFMPREHVEDVARQMLDGLPPTRKQAEVIVTAWQHNTRTLLSEWVEVEFIRRLTHGEAVPPLPGEVNHNPFDWKVEPDSEAAQAHDAIVRNRTRDQQREAERTAHELSAATREVKLFERYVREPFKRLLRK